MTSTRPYHHGNLRAALLDAAEVSVEGPGIEQLSLRELARTVGVSHGAPRSHFPDRRSLLDALAARGFDRLAADMREACAASGPAFVDRLRATATAYLSFAARSPALLEVMYAGKRRSDAPALQAAAAGTMAVVHDLISDGIAEGYLADRDPQHYALLLFSWVRGISTLVTGGVVAPDAVDDLTADAVATFVRGSATATATATATDRTPAA